MKKLVSLLLSFALLLMLSVPVFAQSKDSPQLQTYTNVSLNDEQLRNKSVHMVSINSTNYFSLRSIFDVLGYVVTYNANTKEILATKYGNAYKFSTESTVYEYNGSKNQLNSPLKIVNGRQFISYEDAHSIFNLEIAVDESSGDLLIYQQLSQGYLWKVQKGDTVVYLLGSVHAGVQNMYPVRDEIEKAYYLSDYVVVEVDTSKQMSEEEALAILKLASYEEGDSLKNHIPAELYELIIDFSVNVLGLKKEDVDSTKPWFLAQQFSNLNTLYFEAHEEGYGVENYFVANANNTKKPVLELESYMIQFNAFNSHSPDTQTAQLAYDFYVFSENFKRALEAEANNTEFVPVDLETGPTAEDLIALWIEGDDKKLEELVKMMKDTSVDQYENLLVNRHGLMIEKIESYLNSGKDESYFVIAGFMHMLGEDGLVTLLKNRGYEVTRL